MKEQLENFMDLLWLNHNILTDADKNKVALEQYLTSEKGKQALSLFSISESALNDDIELELRQRTQELPNKTTACEKLYYEVGWRESAKHTKMLISHSR